MRYQTATAALCGLGLFGLAPSAADAAPLKPDLRTHPLPAIKICQEDPSADSANEACLGQGRTVLRVTNRIADAGAGPLEVAPVPPAQDIPPDCHGDGNPDITGDGIPDDNDTWVEQRVFDDGNGNGKFDRAADTGFTSNMAGCRYYHAEHDHYHLDGFARFLLRSERTGKLVRTGNKISFCVADSGYFNLSLPGAPQPVDGKGYYRASGCRTRQRINGISIGWYDEYRWSLAGQEIDITGITAGEYCLIAQADPDRTLLESNDANNNRRVRLRIDPAQAPLNDPTGRDLKPLSGPCTLGGG